MPTIDTTRLQYVMDLLVKAQRSVLLVGEAGTSKTATIRQYLSTPREVTATKQITFSAAATPLVFQRCVQLAYIRLIITFCPLIDDDEQVCGGKYREKARKDVRPCWWSDLHEHIY